MTDSTIPAEVLSLFKKVAKAYNETDGYDREMDLAEIVEPEGGYVHEDLPRNYIGLVPAPHRYLIGVGCGLTTLYHPDAPQMVGTEDLVADEDDPSAPFLLGRHVDHRDAVIYHPTDPGGYQGAKRPAIVSPVINTPDEALSWLQEVAEYIGPGFHPDEPFAEYVYYETSGGRLFTDEEAEAMDRAMAFLMDRDGFGIDPYEATMEIQQRQLKELKRS